jgi:hypothetical protein
MMMVFNKCGCKIEQSRGGGNAGMTGLYQLADELLSPGLTFETRRYRLPENRNLVL